MRPLISPGDVLRLRPGDYRIGSTPLTLRVTHMPKQADGSLGSDWLGLHGMELRPDGTPMVERAVLVRVQALIGRLPAEPTGSRVRRPKPERGDGGG